MGKINGKVALITGAGSGIGKAASVLFAREEAKVMVASIVVEKVAKQDWLRPRCI